MTNNRVSILLLSVIALCLAALVGENWVKPVHAATGVHWEYKVLFRGLKYDDQNRFVGINSWREDQTTLPNYPDEDRGAGISKKIAELGAQGWELVGVTPYSVTGYTVHDLWVFKRAR